MICPLFFNFRYTNLDEYFCTSVSQFIRFCSRRSLFVHWLGGREHNKNQEGKKPYILLSILISHMCGLGLELLLQSQSTLLTAAFAWHEITPSELYLLPGSMSFLHPPPLVPGLSPWFALASRMQWR